MINITANRVRAMIEDCTTEMEVAKALRAHKVKYTFTTDTGFLTIRIPCRKGSVRVYRTCSRAARFAVQHRTPGNVHAIPVLHTSD